MGQLEVTNRRVIRDLQELNRRLRNSDNTMIIVAKAKVVQQEEGLLETNLYVGVTVVLINLKLDKQDTGIIKRTLPT